MKLTIKKSNGDIEAQIEIQPKRPILKQIEEAGIEMHSACHAGICGACICMIEK
jgi:ferredoxin